MTVWDEMTADIKQLADIIRTEYSHLPLVAFGHSMGSALTQSHIENHGDQLAGAILCGTLGAVPGLDEDAYDPAIQQLYTAATGPNANAPSAFFGQMLMGLNAPFITSVSHPTGSGERSALWQTFFEQHDLFGDLWLPQPLAAGERVTHPRRSSDPDRRRDRRSGRR